MNTATRLANQTKFWRDLHNDKIAEVGRLESTLKRTEARLLIASQENAVANSQLAGVREAVMFWQTLACRLQRDLVKATLKTPALEDEDIPF
jgi:hypothetical protein